MAYQLSRISKGGKFKYNTIHTRVTVVVTEIRFQSVVPIYYARIGQQRQTKSYFLPGPSDAPASRNDAFHLKPCEERPATNYPHWKKETSTNDAECSWPAVYLRNGAKNSRKAQLKTSLALSPNKLSASICPKNKDNIEVWAESDQGLKLKPKIVSFIDGRAEDLIFDIQGLPATVKHLDGLTLTWKYLIAGLTYTSLATRHTLFVLDEKPKRANLDGGNEYLWDVLVWSCNWANGVSGHKAVFSSIWEEFHPVKQGHATGLIYWKNHPQNEKFPPKHSLDAAVRSQDHPVRKEVNAASCIVFDLVLINCLAAQGIASAEIKLTPQKKPFLYRNSIHHCIGWIDTTTVGQGNPHAPSAWASHWIAAVNLPDSLGDRWEFYDPSYGAGPACSLPPPRFGDHSAIEFEPLTVKSWRCVNSDMARVILPRNNDPTIPPHLQGKVLWENFS